MRFGLLLFHQRSRASGWPFFNLDFLALFVSRFTAPCSGASLPFFSLSLDATTPRKSDGTERRIVDRKGKDSGRSEQHSTHHQPQVELHSRQAGVPRRLKAHRIQALCMTSCMHDRAWASL